ncbi:MAB_1171c family putative transporter [Rhodococcus sp. T7]|uniref:MAB_1171c family putative transporter n=1 Tax=Rhodococcus sp. T7 TaxID=627444 RepID=UPI0013CD598D|nr:MAB_1171c family putative transporter [Rhodococcus sp. T7]KAF0963822.1 hypothetical protein MLGJGCBP_03089 [Rhodococcus sp. T7]
MPPAFVVWPVLALIWGVALVRFAVLRSTLAEHRMNAALTFAALSVTLPQPGVRELASSWLGRGAATSASNICIMLMAASLLSLFSTWALGPDRMPRIHSIALIAMAVPSMALIFLSGPAREANVSIEKGAAWYFAAYCITYSIPLFSACVLITWIAAKSIRRASRGRERRIFVAVLALAFVEAMDMALIAAAGVLNVVREGNGFTEVRAESGLLVRLIAVSVGTLIAAGPAVRVLGHRWRSRRVIRRLQPMWRTLTGAVPEVVLELRPADRRALSVRGRLDRMSVEIRDAIMILDRHVVFELGDHTGIAPPVVTAARLHLACLARSAGHRAHGTGGTTHRFATDVGGEPWELARLADHWKDGEQTAAALWARRLPQFGGPEDPSARVPAQV